MAKSMIDEIFLAEEAGEKTIAEAKKRADEIIKSAQLEAKVEAQSLLADAKEEARKVILAAEKDAVGITDSAKTKVLNDCAVLEEAFSLKKGKAVDTAISILA